MIRIITALSLASLLTPTTEIQGGNIVIHKAKKN
jgi:hypothetical protein